MTEPADSIFRSTLDSAPEGIVLCEAGGDQAVVYVNAAFERMTGYAAADLLGRNLRLLQGMDRDQDARRRIREAIAAGEDCRVLLRNYRKDGGQFWNEVWLQPLRDAAGELTHFAAFYRDAGERLKAPERPAENFPTWMREDRVSGVHSREWFDDLLQREWELARRESRALTLVLFDIDGLVDYNDTFGRVAGDACIRRVARTVANAFRRGPDVVGRWGDNCIAVLAAQPVVASSPGVAAYAESVVQRIAELRIHNPRGTTQKFITVSAGLASCEPNRAGTPGPEALVRAATTAMERARSQGCSQLVVATAPDGDGDPPPG